MERIKHYQSEERKGISEGQEWIDQDLAVKADIPLVDAGTGKKLIVRLFDFHWNPTKRMENIKRARSNKQEFFNHHAQYIKDFLWKDGLRYREDHYPKLMFSKKGYRIAVLCEARGDTFIDQIPTTLQNIMKPFNKLKK